MLNYYDRTKKHCSQVVPDYVRVETLVDGEIVVTYELSEPPDLPPAEHFKEENLMKAGLDPSQVMNVHTSNSNSVAEGYDTFKAFESAIDSVFETPPTDIPE